jgi:hypothetical protein
MQTKMRTRSASLAKTEASFIEPMECLAVSKLPEGLQWIWEILSSTVIAPSRSSPKLVSRSSRGEGSDFIFLDIVDFKGVRAG